MNTEKTSPPDSLGSPSGYSSFADLCETLIEEEGHHWLHPIVKRYRSTEWSAEIHTRPLDDERTEKLAFGQMGTMEEACAQCVEDFHERARIRARKEELLKDSNVKEALKLFGHNVRPLATGESAADRS